MSGLKDEKSIKKSKPTRKLKHTNSVLEYFVYFCQMSSKLILIILSYTVPMLVRVLRRDVYCCLVCYVGSRSSSMEWEGSRDHEGDHLAEILWITVLVHPVLLQSYHGLVCHSTIILCVSVDLVVTTNNNSAATWSLKVPEVPFLNTLSLKSLRRHRRLRRHIPIVVWAMPKHSNALHHVRC